MSTGRKFLEEQGVSVLKDMAIYASRSFRDYCGDKNASSVEIAETQMNLAVNYLSTTTETTFSLFQAQGMSKKDLYEVRKDIRLQVIKFADSLLTDEFYSYEENME